MSEPESKLRKLQLCELSMLKEAVRICEEHGLTYYLSAGTFLGAVRHKGFIPWDDDADLRMPRPDYEKFLACAKTELSSPYVLEHHTINPEIHRYYTRITDPRVTLKRTHSVKGEVSPAWIDIFPLDGMPANKLHNRLRQIRLLYRRMWFQISVFDELITLNKKRPWYERAIIWVVRHTPIQRCVSYDRMWTKLDKAMKAYPVDKAEYLVNFMGFYKFKDMIPKSVYGNGADYSFEGCMLRGPEDYDTFLKKLYNDYMQLPPEEDRYRHAIEIVNI